MGKILNAKECYFVVQEGDEYMPKTAVIVPIKFWDKNHFWDDSIGGHNVNNDDLINGGCCDTEMMEGVFECDDDDLTIDDFKQKMIDAGFIYNEQLISEFN